MKHRGGREDQLSPRQREVQELAELYAVDAISALHEIVQNSTNDAAKTKAAALILDRALGKAPVVVKTENLREAATDTLISMLPRAIKALGPTLPPELLNRLQVAGLLEGQVVDADAPLAEAAPDPELAVPGLSKREMEIRRRARQRARSLEAEIRDARLEADVQPGDEVSIHDVGLRPRVRSLLAKKGCQTLGAVRKAGRKRLLSDGMGQTSFQQVRDVLCARGLMIYGDERWWRKRQREKWEQERKEQTAQLKVLEGGLDNESRPSPESTSDP